MVSATAFDGTIQRKMIGREVIATSGAGFVIVGKGIPLIISNEDMDDIIKIKNL